MIQKADGTTLTNRELENFLINSDLYRFSLADENTLIYSCSTDFLNTDHATIDFSYQTKNGDIVKNKLYFLYTGVDVCFVADGLIDEIAKEKTMYPFYYDLVIDSNVNIKSDDEDVINPFYHIYLDENNNAYHEVVEESKEDYILCWSETTKDTTIPGVYGIELVFEDDDFEVISAYIDSNLMLENTSDIYEQLAQSVIPMGYVVSGASLVQSLNGNPDWHCRVDYYDINTREFIETVVIR